MNQISDPALASVFEPHGKIRALVVAGACGNVGFGKLGQFARLLVPHGIPVVALDLSPAVHEITTKLREAFGSRVPADQVDRVVAGITVVQGGIADVPKDMEIGFVFEAIPERLELKHRFYEQVHGRDPEAYIFSATSGFPSKQLFGHMTGRDRCGVMHPFFPHLTNKLFEVATAGATTSEAQLTTVRKMLTKLGMNIIPVADVPAFAADRIFCGMMLEAVRIHEDLGLTPAQVDDACKQLLGTSPFLVHNLIAGANYLSAHCMDLCAKEVDSSLFRIPASWSPYVEDPKLQWPYERGQRCPADALPTVQTRMYGMLISLTAYMLEHRVVEIDALNFLCEQALAMSEGIPALIERLGPAQARELAQTFLRTTKVTRGEEVAPLAVLDPDEPMWRRIYVKTQVIDGIGLISLQRSSLTDTFLAELDHAWSELQANPTVKAMVLAPDGNYNRDFGHGADLKAFVPVLGNEAEAHKLIERWKHTTTKLRSGKPTVAALVGRVLGGSLELAAACHARVAATGTKLAFPETTVGVVPGLGGCHMVHRQSHDSAQAEIDRALLCGHGFTPETAEKWGFVQAVVPPRELAAASMALAAKMAADPSAIPACRTTGAQWQVTPDAPTHNEAKVALDADLREWLMETIARTNAAELDEANRIEAKRAAHSLAMGTAKIGVTAMLRGKAPAFGRPLA